MTEKTKKTKSKKTPAGSKVTKEFVFKLTDKEVREKLRGSRELRLEYDAYFSKCEEAKETMKAKLTALRARRDDAQRLAEDGEEKRMVEAVMVKDYEAKEVQYWFNGEMMESRTMTENELQMEVDFKKTEKKARAIKQTLQKTEKTDPIAHANGKMTDIAEVHSLETGRKTKTSAVDGPTRM